MNSHLLSDVNSLGRSIVAPDAESIDLYGLAREIVVAAYSGTHLGYLPILGAIRETPGISELARARIALVLGLVCQRIGRLPAARSYLNLSIQKCKQAIERGDPAALEIGWRAHAYLARCLSQQYSLTPGDIVQRLRAADSQIQRLPDPDKKLEIQAGNDWRLAMWEQVHAGNPDKDNYYQMRHKEFVEQGTNLDQLATHYGAMSMVDLISNRRWDVINRNSQLAFMYCVRLNEWTSVANVLCLQGLAELGSDIDRPSAFTKLLLVRAWMPRLHMTEQSAGMAEVLRFGKESSPKGVFFFSTAYDLLCEGWPDKKWIPNEATQQFDTVFQSDKMLIQGAWEWVKQVTSEVFVRNDNLLLMKRLKEYGLATLIFDGIQVPETPESPVLAPVTTMIPSPKSRPMSSLPDEVQNLLMNSRRQKVRQILNLMFTPNTYEQIAELLVISPRTVQRAITDFCVASDPAVKRDRDNAKLFAEEYGLRDD